MCLNHFIFASQFTVNSSLLAMKKSSYSWLIQPKFNRFLLTSLLGLALWAGAFLWQLTAVYPASESAFPQSLQNILPAQSAISYVLGFLCVLTISFMLFEVNEKFSFISRRSTLPFFFFMLLVSTNVQLLEFSVAQLGAIILLLATRKLLAMQGKRMPVGEAYAIGLLLSTGAVLNAEMLFLMPFFWLGFWIFNSLNLRTFLASLIGFVLLFALVAAVMFLSDNMPVFIAAVKENFRFSFGLVQLDIVSLVYLSGLCVFALLAIIYAANHSFKEKINVTRSLNVITMLFIACSMLLVINPLQKNDLLICTALFASMLYAHYFSLHESRLAQVLFCILTAWCLGHYCVALLG